MHHIWNNCGVVLLEFVESHTILKPLRFQVKLCKRLGLGRDAHHCTRGCGKLLPNTAETLVHDHIFETQPGSGNTV